MPRALILVADGSEEIEFVTPYDGKYLLPCNGMLSQQSPPILTYIQSSPEPASKSNPLV
jgi:hypothetical protein